MMCTRVAAKSPPVIVHFGSQTRKHFSVVRMTSQSDGANRCSNACGGDLLGPQSDKDKGATAVPRRLFPRRRCAEMILAWVANPTG